MKQLQLIGMVSGAVLLFSCETTQTAGQGNQEQKRLAALRQAQTQPQADESEQNLQNAQRDWLNSGRNPSVYHP